MTHRAYSTSTKWLQPEVRNSYEASPVQSIGRRESGAMRVLITGGAGFIGSHTAKLLAQSGYQPVVYDNLSTGHLSAVRWGPIIVGDLSNTPLLTAVLREYQIDAVVHFAASAYVGESMEQPAKYFQNNVQNTLSLLNAMLEAGVTQIVFSSSCAVYGDPGDQMITEETLKQPMSPYGESKLFVERVLGWYREAYGMRSVALRYFNAAGSDPDGEIGENHDPETHILPLVIQTALGQRDCFSIFGNDYPTPDGTAVRDYIHVSDLADAHLRALTYLTNGGESTAINLGTGKGYSVRQIVEAVERLSGLPVAVKELPCRAGDPPSLVADASRAASVLGWRPVHSDLDTIVQTAWNWLSRTETQRLDGPYPLDVEAERHPLPFPVRLDEQELAVIAD